MNMRVTFLSEKVRFSNCGKSPLFELLWRTRQVNGSRDILPISQINVLLTLFLLAHKSLIASCNSRLGFYLHLVVLLMMPQPKHCSGRIIKNQLFLLLQKEK